MNYQSPDTGRNKYMDRLVRLHAGAGVCTRWLQSMRSAGGGCGGCSKQRA